jgi:hypothetical protein
VSPNKRPPSPVEVALRKRIAERTRLDSGPPKQLVEWRLLVKSPDQAADFTGPSLPPADQVRVVGRVELIALGDWKSYSMVLRPAR